VEATGPDGEPLVAGDVIAWAVDTARRAHATGNTVIFVGNGGSAGIASHMAVDFMRNGGIRALAFNDGVALTCLGNDLGYENVFAKQIEMYGRAGDLLVAISSSGRSPNILKAVAAARRHRATVLTLSGFDADNPLRRLGDVNLYVPSQAYGFVEISHLALIHAIGDFSLGWGETTVSQEGKDIP
jgi:D-sedoheptulose 7-phosphate isomerase